MKLNKDKVLEEMQRQELTWEALGKKLGQPKQQAFRDVQAERPAAAFRLAQALGFQSERDLLLFDCWPENSKRNKEVA